MNVKDIDIKLIETNKQNRGQLETKHTSPESQNDQKNGKRKKKKRTKSRIHNYN